MALVGYARVSTADQGTALQADALRKAGCERIFDDTVSGATAERPGLAAALAYLCEGDVLVVWRLGRSLPHLIELISVIRRCRKGGHGPPYRLKTQREQQRIFDSLHLDIVQGGNEGSNLGLGYGLHMIQIDGADLGYAIFRGQDHLAGNLADRGGDGGDRHFAQHV